MAKTIKWDVPMDQLTESSYNFYIYGMTSAAKEAKILVKDPNGNTWTGSTRGMSQGQPFTLQNPAAGSTKPFGWTLGNTTRPYTFEVTIASTSGSASNEGIAITAINDDRQSVMAVVQYNDSGSSDDDYNDVVLTMAFFPEEPTNAGRF